MRSATEADLHDQPHTRPFMGTKLHPRQGAPAGLFAGSGMLIVWLTAAQLWGPGAKSLLTSIGGILVTGNELLAIATGIFIHLVIAVGLGMLFAASLDRLDSKDTLIVSTFYGFTIWIVSILILRHWVHVDAIHMSRSWWGFLVFLFFGFLLGVYANHFGQAPSNF